MAAPPGDGISLNGSRCTSLTKQIAPAAGRSGQVRRVLIPRPGRKKVKPASPREGARSSTTPPGIRPNGSPTERQHAQRVQLHNGPPPQPKNRRYNNMIP